MSRLPLRLRLTVAFALAMAVLLGATGGFLYLRLEATLDEQLEQTLRARADDVAALVRSSGPAAAGGGLGAGRLADSDESFAQVLGADGTVIRATPPLERTPLLDRAEVARARRGTLLADRRLGDTPVRLLATPVERDLVVVGVSIDDRNEALAGLKAQLLIGGPLALLLASAAGYALAAAALRPVEAMRRRAEEISATTAGRRLPVPRRDDEVGRLARTLNEMLARLESGLERERRFVAEASHELRTPLALLKTALELALRRPRTADELRAALESAADETDRLALLADALLVLARAEEGALPLAREDVPARDLLEVVARRFGASGRPLELAVDEGVTVVADRLRLEQALGNLVDNALRHGAGAVRLEAAPEDGLVALRVSDEGGGFPAEFLPRAFDRFSRADGSRSGSGAGLGLALVAEIARAHGGSVRALNLPDGGACVVVLLPRDL
jgi:two-component system OmpR family sensor kinase